MKNKKIFFLVAAVLLVSLSFTSCKRNRNSNTSVNLNSNWMYSLEDPFTTQAKFEVLDNMYLTNLESLVPGKKGSIWLKMDFTVPDTLKGKDISCYLGRITLADRTYLNNQLIGHEGFFPPMEFTAWNTTRFYEIPESLLNEKNNTLIIEIFVEGEGSIVSNPFIGIHEETKRAYERERFWNSQINLLFAFIMIIIAAYHVIIFLIDKTQKESLYFSLVNITTVLYMIVFYISELPGLPTNKFSFLLFQKLFSSAMPYVLVYMTTAFVNEFLENKENKIFFIARIVCLVVPVLVVMFTPDYIHLRAINSALQLLLLPPLVYIVYLLIKSAIKKNMDSVKLFIGFIPFVLFTLADLVIHNIFKVFDFPYISMIGWQIVIISLLFILAQRFSLARKRAEYLNKHLADEVENQTKELTQSNDQLTSVVNELNESKLKAEKDMKMAVYAQQSIYQHMPPFVDGWDIAFKFQPKSGISGDLYDFYTEGKTLNGISLFDSSGQGLAAGLVALLSKSVVEEEFNKNKNEHLATVMSKINNSIYERKGNIDNYLKGLLIRLTDNKVEYVSAGNPTILLRSAKTGKCSPVELKNSVPVEKSVGFTKNFSDYKVIGFNVSAGDSLILYTESFIKQKNDYDSEYTKNRLAKVFTESGNGNAQSKLNAVINDFQNFSQKTPAEGDWTVIVLQKV